MKKETAQGQGKRRNLMNSYYFLVDNLENAAQNREMISNKELHQDFWNTQAAKTAQYFPGENLPEGLIINTDFPFYSMSDLRLIRQR